MKPTDFIGEKVSYDRAGQMIFGHKGDKLQLLLDVRGWGAIQHLFNTEKEAATFQDEFGEWMAEAINEKLNNESSELLKQRDELLEALKNIANPITYMESKLQDGERLNGMMAIQLGNNPEYLKGIAQSAITKAEER